MFGLRLRQWLVVAVAVAVAYSLTAAIAVVGTWMTLTRDPTPAELRRAADVEVARRWQAWPSGRIFPERLAYAPPDGRQEQARRAGIATDTACEAGLDPDLVGKLRALGCRGVLRATYVDRLQGVVVTVGVVVFPDPTAAARARREVPGSATALRAAPFPGTVAARFEDPARQYGTAERGGPYLALSTAGQADGRPAEALGDRRRTEIFEFAPQLAHTVLRALSTPALPDCDRPEWRC
ncbi:hypothetical protein [Actinomadura craniellae]|uniref:hypothetical protein n=1 Tax=Actinomadura craniellae TaxID=2231787 RepID=UPI001314CCDA|nr:hypothetical protein [Actinomadura craniellae]